MSSSNNYQEESHNDDDGGSEMGIAYTINEEVDDSNNLTDNLSNSAANIRNFTPQSTVEYLEFLATQEPYSPENLNQSQGQFREGPTLSNIHYVISPDDPLTETNHNNDDNYNPYFPPTHQIDLYYNNNNNDNNNNDNNNNNNNNHLLTLSPLDEVVQNNLALPNDDDNCLPLFSQQVDHDNQQIHHQQFQNQFPQSQIQYDHINEVPSSPIDHSAVTPSPLALPGLLLSRNRSRISTRKVEISPTLPNAYTAQVQQSDSPLRSEFRRNDLEPPSENFNLYKIRLSEILLNNNKSSDQQMISNERTIPKNNLSQKESLRRFDFRDATGDPDDPLLN